MRSLPRNLNMSKGVKRLVNSARSAAQAFPNSVLIAMFHAKLLLLSGRLDLAAAECHRAIYLEDVTDPEEECVPPGSIEGHDLQARLSSVAGDFELLLKKIIESAEKCWENSLTTDIKRRFLLVKISALQNEYAKVDKSPGSNIQSALNFIKQNDSWRFWMCPLCSSNKRHSTSSLLMDHMHKKHARIFLPRLKSVISSTLDSDSDGLCHGMSFTQDKDNHDIIQFEERSGLFRWLFSAAIRGEKARPFDKIAQENRTQGTELLEIMKQKMASLPTEKSTTYESPMLDEIREIWLQFLKSTVFDYGKILLTLARTLLWSEFKEHMAGVLKDGCQNITADDVDDAFSTWSNADTQKMKEDVSYPTESQKPTNVSVDQEAVGILNLDLNFSDINLMDIALKALWSLNHFSHELIKAENPCSKNNHDGPCVGDIVHRAFCSWWKGEYPREELASLAKAVHKILDAAAFQKDQINCISDITFAILNGLHLPDLCLYIGFVGDTSQERIALKCKFHDSLGMKFLQNMSCGCQTCSSEKSDLDANIVEQQCSQCSSAALKERYSIIDDREGGPTLPEIFSGRLEPTMTFKYEHGEAFYKLSAMICYLDGCSIGIAQKAIGWIIFSETMELDRYESWEGLLDRCRDCRPAVLFYEVIK